MQLISKAADLDFDPEIAAKYPVGRIYDYQGYQVVVVRDTCYDGSPSVSFSFQTGSGLCSCHSPYAATADGAEQRDSQYAAMIGHESLPTYLVEVIRTVWEDKGRPPKGDSNAVSVRRVD